mmetsp:Transcript_24083/g.35022  ORF Transcript_24083/g.35022 Transcript_24083/m.35022 type:complete len:311 (+) Transcript_24083:109-1041(+)
MAERDIFHLFHVLYKTKDRKKQKIWKDGKKQKTWNDILTFLQKQPDAAKQKNEYGETPLHIAYLNKAPFKVVNTLLQIWPNASKEKDVSGSTPLHIACSIGTPFGVVALLLQVWPDAVYQKDSCGRTPIHWACLNIAPLEVVVALLQVWPDSVKEKDGIGSLTPLNYACLNRAPMEVVIHLLNNWLSYKENTTNGAIINCQTNTTDLTEDVRVLFSHLFALCISNTLIVSRHFPQYLTLTHPPKETMDYFIRIQLWNGTTLVLDRNPTVIKTMGLDTKVMADFLCRVGRCCNLTTMWVVLSNEQDLLEGV